MTTRTCTLVAAALLLGCLPNKRVERMALEDPWSPASLQRSVDEILHLVEAEAGRRFLEPPKVAVADEETFQELLYHEQLGIYEQVMADTPEPIRRQLAEAAGHFMSSGILGKYILATETVYLCPGAILPAMEHSEMDPERVRDVIKVVLAHELTHVLEDQHTDLERQLSLLRDEEDLWAAAGAWEGWATLVEERVSEALGLSDIYEGLISLQGWGPDGLEDQSAWRTWAIYGQGRNFIEWHDIAGGVEQVWSALARPPGSTGMLFRPHSYTPDRLDADLDYGAVLRGIDQELTRGDWMVTNSRLGEFDLRGEANRAGNEDQLDEILGHLRHARKLDLARPDRNGAVRLLVFDDAAWARAWLDLVRTQQTHDAAETAHILELDVQVRYEHFDVDADDAILRVERIPLGVDEYREKHTAWVLRDDTMVVVEAERFAPGERLARVVETVLERLDGEKRRGDIVDGASSH